MSMKSTISTRGHLIDPYCQYQSGAILEVDNNIYDCTLNQTDIGSNKNKFYIMQLIKMGNMTYCYIRYGRIGETGRISYKNFTSDHGAIGFFEKQFRSKTGNSWYNRDNFQKQNGKYYMADIEHEEISDADTDTDMSSDSSLDELELDRDILYLIQLISNKVYMKNTLVQLEIDINKMPLGKINQNQIDRAYKLLNTIMKNLRKPSELIKLSSEFYTLIPYACGRQQPPLISSRKHVGKFINLLNELSQMAHGTKAITKLKNTSSDIIQFYESLKTEIIPMNESDSMYPILAEYLTNSKAPTHHFKFKIIKMYEIDRAGERDKYDAYSKNFNNKTLLFHGTRVSNLISILQNGLIVDLSKLNINVCITGKMFGLGLYFANSVSKSIQYCAYDSSDNIACVFVAEIALGRMLKKKQSDSSLTTNTLPDRYHSTWGMGQSSYEFLDIYEDDTHIPQGKLTRVTESIDRSLLYDEFIVYHEEQVNLRYLIVLKID